MIRIFPRELYWRERNALRTQGEINARILSGRKTPYEIRMGKYEAAFRPIEAHLEAIVKAETKAIVDVLKIRKDPLGNKKPSVSEIDIFEIRENPLGKKPPIVDRPLNNEIFKEAADSRFNFDEQKTPLQEELEELYEEKLNAHREKHPDDIELSDLVKKAPLGLGDEKGEISLSTTSEITGLPEKALEEIRDIGRNITEGNYFKL